MIKKNLHIITILVITFFVILMFYIIKNKPEKEEAILKPIGEIPNTMRPAIMLDGSLYYTTGRTIDKKKLDLNSVSQVKSVVAGTKYPEKNEEINLPFENAKYMRVGDDVAVEIDGAWILFKKDE